MFCYRFFGFILYSELEFPELQTAIAARQKPDIVIRFGRAPARSIVATLDEDLAFHPFAGAFYIKRGREIIIDPLPNVNPDVLRILLLGRMMAFLMRQVGWLPLHASVISLGGEGILFIGPSGAGKSTTAAAFHSRGHQVLSDDVGAVRVLGKTCHVRAAGSRLRLRPDSINVLAGDKRVGEFQWDKFAFNLGSTQSAIEPATEIPVRRIYLLNYGSEIRLEPVTPMTVVPLLSANSFTVHSRMSAEALRAHFTDCASVAALSLVRSLYRPKSLQELPKLIGQVERDILSD